MVSTRQSSNSGSNAQQVGISSTIAAAQVLETSSYINLLDLPVEVLQKILGYLDYNTIAHLRPVCHQMDRVCGSILNSAFQRLQTQMLSRFQAIKAQMPRRESARRNHPLACESDIIETLHMRLTLLQMSFGKHIERKHCCFFPGEILDEVYRILHYIKVTPKLARPYKVTDELFDLSTMAMEYFKDCIEPTLPEIPYFGADFLDLAGTFTSPSSVNKFSLCLDTAPLSVTDGKTRGSGVEGSPLRSSNEETGCSSPGLDVSTSAPPASPPQSNRVLRKRIRKIKQGMKRYNSQLTLMRRDLRSCKAKIAEQQKQIVEYATRLDENDKKNEETSRKFSTLLQELNKCKTELQYWRSKSPAIPVCFGCGQSIPMPPDDLQALANQGVLSNLEATINEGLDFIPIADIEVHNSSGKEIDSILAVQAPQSDVPKFTQSQEEEQLILYQALSKISCSSTNTVSSNSNTTSSPTEPIAPLVSMPLISSKRKPTLPSLEEEITKKPRRALKTRQAKRSKF